MDRGDKSECPILKPYVSERVCKGCVYPCACAGTRNPSKRFLRHKVPHCNICQGLASARTVCPISLGPRLSDISRPVRRQAEQVVLRRRLWRVHGLLVLRLRRQRQPLREPGTVRPAVRGFQRAGQSVSQSVRLILEPRSQCPFPTCRSVWLSFPFR